MLAPYNSLKAEAISGRGYLFLVVILFNPQKSIQGQSDLSFLSTKKNPAPAGEEDNLMIPAASKGLSIASLSGTDREYRQPQGGVVLGWRSMAQS